MGVAATWYVSLRGVSSCLAEYLGRRYRVCPLSSQVLLSVFCGPSVVYRYRLAIDILLLMKGPMINLLILFILYYLNNGILHLRVLLFILLSGVLRRSIQGPCIGFGASLALGM